MQYIREQCGLTLEVVCDQLHWQQSKLSRMENGQQCISHADLASLLVIYKVHGQERQWLLHMANRQDDPGYWENHPEVSMRSRTLMRLEPAANAIVNVEPLLICGLVQTADYARAVMRSFGLPDERIDAQAGAQTARQSVLTKANPTQGRPDPGRDRAAPSGGKPQDHGSAVACHAGCCRSSERAAVGCAI
jgi:hypothetical protein